MKKITRKALLTAKLYRPGKAGGGSRFVGNPDAEGKIYDPIDRDINLGKFLSRSKNLDEEGNHRKLYHATTRDFSTFKPGGYNPKLSGEAIWLSPRKDRQPAAHNLGYANEGFREGANVMPLWGSIKNPLVLRNSQEAKAFCDRHGLPSSGFPLAVTPEHRAKLIELGHDGVFWQPGTPEEEVLALHPNQLKSATGNRGTFDPNEDDINKADGGSILMPGDPQREANLKEWFGKGHAANASGQPATLYHGTNSNFSAFDPNEAPDRGGIIAFASTSPKFASDYAGETGNVMPVHVSVQNPFDFRKHHKEAEYFYDEFGGISDPVEAARILAGLNKLPENFEVYKGVDPSLLSKEDFHKAVKSGSWDAIENPEFVQWLRRYGGYDGILTMENGALNYGVFHPSQLKSATGNRGTFDPNEDDINKAAGGRTGYADGGTPAQDAADHIAFLLREGRAKEVTDDLMDQADPKRLYEHYESGNTGMQMPMDEASRMERAKALGFDVKAYRGQTGDPGASLNTIRTEGKTAGTGAWATSDPDIAATYSGTENPVSVPMMIKSSGYQTHDFKGKFWGDGPKGKTTDELARASKAPGVHFKNITDVGPHLWNRANLQKRIPETADSFAIKDPKTVRSMFARFDPRLAHLSHMSAATGGRTGYDTGGTPDDEGFDAYHGSPYLFDKFDLTKVGTGEGAQKYGHGAYLGDLEDVGRGYRDRIALGKNKFNIVDKRTGEEISPDTLGYPPVKDFLDTYAYDLRSGDIKDFIEHRMDNFKNADLKAIKEYEDGAASGLVDAGGAQWLREEAARIRARVPHYDAAKDLIKRVRAQPIGHMYQVHVNAPKAKFIDWDRLLSEQHPVVRAVLGSDPSVTAGQLLERAMVDPEHAGRIVGKPSATKAELSAHFLANGIPGIQYLDEGSRYSDQKTRNYVVFDDKALHIKRRYEAGGRTGYADGGMAEDPLARLQGLNLNPSAQPDPVTGQHEDVKAAYPQTVYHGSTDPNVEQVKDRSRDARYMTLGVGMHVAKDPEISNSRRFVGSPVKGNVMPLRMADDSKFLTVPQPVRPSGKIKGDDDSIEHLIMKVAYPHHSDLLAKALEKSAIIDGGLSPSGYRSATFPNEDQAKEAAQKLLSGEEIWTTSGPMNFDKFLDHYHPSPEKGEDSQKLIHTFHRKMREQGIQGLRYINTDEDETTNSKDDTCYIVFPPPPEGLKQGEQFPLRSRFAKFDPAHMHEPGLMKSEGGEVVSSLHNRVNPMLNKAMKLARNLTRR